MMPNALQIPKHIQAGNVNEKTKSECTTDSPAGFIAYQTKNVTAAESQFKLCTAVLEFGFISSGSALV